MSGVRRGVVNYPEGETMMRKLLVLAAILTAVLCAGWKWNTAQARTSIECEPYCHPSRPAPPHLPEPGPCYYHGGVAWVVAGYEGARAVLYYGCLDGTVVTVGA